MIARYRHWERQSRFGLAGATLGAVVAIPTSLAAWYAGEPQAQAIAILFLVVVAIAYAVARLGWSHPLENARYGMWLQASPWTPSQRLPHGSPYLNVNDGAFLLAIWLGSPSPTAATLSCFVIAFAVGYIVRADGTARRHHETVLPVGIFLVVGLAIAFSFGTQGPTAWPLLLATVAALVLSQVSTRRLLDKLHDLVILPPGMNWAIRTQQSLAASQRYGSPWAQLLVGIEDESEPSPWWSLPAGLLYITACCEILRMRAVAWASTLNDETVLDLHKDLFGAIGAMTYFLVQLSSDPSVVQRLWVSAVLMPIPFIASTLVVLAIASFDGETRAPISLPGRVATGRLYLPKYDILWSAPAAAFLVYLLGMMVSYVVGASIVVAMGVSIALAVASYGWLSPSRLQLRLTGHHRIVCGPPPALRKP